MTKETYAEAGVKQKASIKTILIKIGLILLIFVTLPISRIASFLYIVPVAAILAAFFFIPRLNLEYEYIYVDGQIDFDRIMGGAKRKTVLRVDMENVEIVAPSTSAELQPYERKEGIVVKDFSSRQPNSRTYTLVANMDGKYTKVIFEPSAKMIECIKWKAPRKLKEY